MIIRQLPRHPVIGQMVSFHNDSEEGMMLTRDTRGHAGQMIYLSPEEAIGLEWNGLKWHKIYNDFNSEDDQYLYRIGL